MFGSSILEVAIGIVLIYLFLSLICSAINEGIASIINKRGRNLFEGIKNLLNDPKFTGLAQQLYTHGLVDSISKEAVNPAKPNRAPSYMSSRTFALALLDLLGSQGVVFQKESWETLRGQRQAELDAAQTKLDEAPTDPGLQKRFEDAKAALKQAQENLQKATGVKQAHDAAASAAKEVTGPEDFDKLGTASKKLGEALALGRALAAEIPDPLSNIQKAVENLPDGHTKQSLAVLIDKTKREIALVSNQVIAAEHHIEKLQENIEHWFNDAMDRVGGWYKRWTQVVHLIVAILLVSAVNADTIMLAKRFTRDNALRASIVNTAEQTVQNAANTPTEQVRQELFKEAEKLNLPLGWVASEADLYKTDQVPATLGEWLWKVLGLLISVFAVSLGATFWFDTVGKFVNLRGAGTPPGEPRKNAPRPASS